MLRNNIKKIIKGRCPECLEDIKKMNVDDFQGRVDAHVGGDEHLLQLVEEVLVDLAAAHGCAFHLLEEAGFGLLEALVESLFLLF